MTLPGEKKILFITFNFPPRSASAVQRPMKFAKYLCDFKWKPFVITPKKNTTPLDDSLRADLPGKVRVEEVFSPDPENMKAILQDKYRKGTYGRVRYLFFKALLKIYSVVYYRIVVIDWYDGWIPFGFFRAKRIMKKEDIDLIFVDMEPPSSSVIGLLLKKVTGKPLVIDYHDAWTTSVDFLEKKGLKKRIAERLERRILASADRVTAGKEKIISGIKDKFGDVDESKFLAIPSGYDPEDFKDLEKEKSDKFVITYTGRISEKFYYSPESFLRALGELIREGRIPGDDIAVVIAGTVSSRYRDRLMDMINELGLKGVVRLAGNLNYKRCLKQQVNSDLLLYIIESVDGKERSYGFAGETPSKLYEYMYTGNPVLAIVPPGIEADLLKRTKTGFVAEPNNVASVKKVLYGLYEKFKQGALEVEPDQGEIHKFNRKKLTARLASLFDELLRER